MRAHHEPGPRTRDGADTLPLEPARLVALREYISLWERGLGTASTFVARAVDALLVHGVTEKALQLLTPFSEVHDELAACVRRVLEDPSARLGRRSTKPLSDATRAALRAWLTVPPAKER